MVTNLKYYVLTVVSIFLALAIGIFIGFMFDAQEILISQKEDIVTQLEESLDELKEENNKIKKEIDEISEENKRLYEFNRMAYGEIISGKLEGARVSIIETNDDYIYTSLKQTLEASGAEIDSVITIKDSILSNKETMEAIYKNVNGVENIEGDIIELMLEQLMDSIITREGNEIVQKLNNEGIIFISEGLNNKKVTDVTENVDSLEDTENLDSIEASNIYNQSIDYIIIAGGSKSELNDRFNIIDEKIINAAKKSNITIIGVEKQDVKYSYAEKYKDQRISTVDNVDTIIGKVALVLAMDGRPGNYGVKPSSESLLPDTSTMITD